MVRPAGVRASLGLRRVAVEVRVTERTLLDAPAGRVATWDFTDRLTPKLDAVQVVALPGGAHGLRRIPGGG